MTEVPSWTAPDVDSQSEPPRRKRRTKAEMATARAAALAEGGPVGAGMILKEERKRQAAANKAVKQAGTLATIQPELTAELAKVEESKRLTAALPLETSDQREFATSIIRMAKGRIEQLETWRKRLVGPLKDEAREIDQTFKRVRDPYEWIERDTRERLSSKLLALQDAQDEALRQIQAGAGEAPAEVLALAHSSTAAPAGVSAPERWEVESVDMGLIPREYLVPNKDLLLGAHDRGVAIPGVKFKRVLGLVVRRAP